MDETAAKQVDNEARFADTRMFGMMDDNIDGKIEKAELRGQMGQMIGRFFNVIDKNGDGGLDVAEMKAAQAMMPQNRRRAADGPNETTPIG
jgi:Ca2+-binding EF-hand superfamily protein